MRTHRDLEAWKLGIELADLAYKTTAGFPPEERFGLTSQIRRAAVSVPTNIAEGAGRETTREFRRFLFIARGSLAEFETLVIIASNAGVLTGQTKDSLLAARDETARTLQGLINSLEPLPR